MMINKRLIIIFIIIIILLLIPLIAMQFNPDVKWNIFDFLIMGVLLLGTGILCELVMRKVKSVKNRIFIYVAILFALLLIWAELAVGIFGSPLAGS